LGMVCIVSLYASLVRHSCACLYCFTFFFTCSSLLGMVCIVLFHASLFHH
jgi:hypothetical protein